MSINDDNLAKDSTITQDGVKYTVTTAGKANAATFKDEDGNTVSLTVKEGAVYTTSLGKSYTLVGRTGVDLSKNLSTATVPTAAAGDKVVDEDGTEYTYVAANGFLNDIQHTTAGFYKSEGNKATDDAYTAKAGDRYTVAATGNTFQIANKGIGTVESIQEKIKGLTDGDKVQIYENGSATKYSEYTIGVSTKENGTAYTADDIANLVKAGQVVKNATDNEFYYALPADSESKTDISLKEAYKLMKNELQIASSIGTDADKQAVVKDLGEGKFEITQGKDEISDKLSFSLHVGADADMTNKISVNVDTMSTAGLGIQGLNVADDSGKAATYAIDAIADAVKTVSKQRSLLGAVQNRLEHTINNLDNVVENTTSAESAIRDTDMATEMVKFSKNNILAQAGQSMLAQANQSNQGVLSLLG